jgi:hypothetical protein
VLSLSQPVEPFDRPEKDREEKNHRCKYEHHMKTSYCWNEFGKSGRISRDASRELVTGVSLLPLLTEFLLSLGAQSNIRPDEAAIGPSMTHGNMSFFS